MGYNYSKKVKRNFYRLNFYIRTNLHKNAKDIVGTP